MSCHLFRPMFPLFNPLQAVSEMPPQAESVSGSHQSLMPHCPLLDNNPKGASKLLISPQTKCHRSSHFPGLHILIHWRFFHLLCMYFETSIDGILGRLNVCHFSPFDSYLQSVFERKKCCPAQKAVRCRLNSAPPTIDKRKLCAMLQLFITVFLVNLWEV